MNKSLLTLALAAIVIAGAGTQASAQTAPANVQAVDLGLPSGLKWASCNIGATTAEEYGNYYAWGETTPKTDYTWATYKYANGDEHKLTKYCSKARSGDNGFTDNLIILEPADDAATVNWGEVWRMPTDAEWTELQENCTWTWTTQNGVNGYQVTSKTNGNSIFLPAAGYRYSTSLSSADSDGYYWSASLNDYTPSNAWSLRFSSGSMYGDNFYRRGGFPVRPVHVTTVPANVQATQGDTTGVTVTWDAVPGAVGYEITAESWDVATNRTVRTKTATETHIKDTIPMRPALGRYTVKAVFADGTKGEASEPAIGWAMLETMRLLGVSNRWPWNGKVDIDVEYKTMRTRFRQLFGLPDLPYPTDVTLTARTVDGKSLPVRSLTKESPVDPGTYTVNRAAVQNGTAIFSGSGEQRFVWDADTDTLGINAPGTTITLTASDDYARTTDSATVDVNTTKQVAIPLPEDSEENDREIAFPWATRWANEASRSLNMQDGTDLKMLSITRYGTIFTTVFEETQLADEGGVFTWRPGNYYGVLIMEATFKNRATADSSLYRAKFLRSVPTPVRVERYKQENVLDIWWTGSADCTYYQIMRRDVYRDGTCSNWYNMAGVSTYSDGPNAGLGRYVDIGVVGGRTYEYTACPLYPDPDTHDYLMAEPVVWAAGRVPMGIVLEAKSAGVNSIGLSWTDVPDAYTYDVYRNSGDGQYQKIGNISYTTGTTFTDTRAEAGKRYTYKVIAFNYKGDTLETSNPAEAYSQLDALYLYNIQPRFPWNGLVDIFVGYRSARDMQQDGTPRFRLVATSGKDTLAMKTLTLASAQTLAPDDFTLPADGTPQRLVWDARTDLGANNFPDGLSLTVFCTRVEPCQETSTAKLFEGKSARGGIVPFDLRHIPEVILGNPTSIYADLGWFEGASRLEVLVNGTSVFNTTDENNYSFPLGKEQLNIWGINTLKLTSDNGMEQTAQIKYPDFVFTATQGNRDSIIVEWNSLYDVQAYSVRRRAANTADAFVEVALVSDTTRWADTSEETFIGEFEYTIMPLLASGEDAGPQPAAVIGWRTQETGIEDPATTNLTPHKVIRHGQVFILRGGKTYTLVGVEVE